LLTTDTENDAPIYSMAEDYFFQDFSVVLKLPF